MLHPVRGFAIADARRSWTLPALLNGSPGASQLRKILTSGSRWHWPFQTPVKNISNVNSHICKMRALHLLMTETADRCTSVNSKERLHQASSAQIAFFRFTRRSRSDWSDSCTDTIIHLHACRARYSHHNALQCWPLLQHRAFVFPAEPTASSSVFTVKILPAI